MSNKPTYKQRTHEMLLRTRPHSLDPEELTWRAELVEKEKRELVIQMREMAEVGRSLIFEYPGPAMIELVEAGVAKRVGLYGFTLVDKSGQ